MQRNIHLIFLFPCNLTLDSCVSVFANSHVYRRVYVITHLKKFNGNPQFNSSLFLQHKCPGLYRNSFDDFQLKLNSSNKKFW